MVHVLGERLCWIARASWCMCWIGAIGCMCWIGADGRMCWIGAGGHVLEYLNLFSLGNQINGTAEVCASRKSKLSF